MPRIALPQPSGTSNVTVHRPTWGRGEGSGMPEREKKTINSRHFASVQLADTRPEPSSHAPARPNPPGSQWGRWPAIIQATAVTETRVPRWSPIGEKERPFDSGEGEGAGERTEVGMEREEGAAWVHAARTTRRPTDRARARISLASCDSLRPSDGQRTRVFLHTARNRNAQYAHAIGQYTMAKGLPHGANRPNPMNAPTTIKTVRAMRPRGPKLSGPPSNREKTGFGLGLGS